MAATHRNLAALTVAGLLVACRPNSDQVVFQLEADRFANSEWSEPVNLGAPVNSSANDNNAALSPDELSLYFVSGRAGGLGGVDIPVSRRSSLDRPSEVPADL